MPKLDKHTHERFCHRYVATRNGGASWRDARGGRRNQRPTPSDRSYASELLTKPNTRERIAELMEVRNQELQVDSLWVLQELVDMYKADSAELFDPETGALLPIDELPVNLRQLLTGVDMDAVATKDKDGNVIALPVVTKVRWTKRLEILQQIGKHVDVQAWRERLELEAGDSLVDLVVQSMQKRDEGQ